MGVFFYWKTRDCRVASCLNGTTFVSKANPSSVIFRNTLAVHWRGREGSWTIKIGENRKTGHIQKHRHAYGSMGMYKVAGERRRRRQTRLKGNKRCLFLKETMNEHPCFVEKKIKCAARMQSIHSCCLHLLFIKMKFVSVEHNVNESSHASNIHIGGLVLIPGQFRGDKLATPEILQWTK